MSVTQPSWARIWRELDAQRADEALLRQLIAAYSEPHRHYHTLQHLRECLQQFAGVRGLARYPAEIELALWFHDAVYDVRRDDNEERSAEWARQSVLAAGLPRELAQRVRTLVMATRHNGIPDDPDARLLVDVDLSILGAPAQRFDEFDMQIRREYAHVQEPQYRQRRSAVLRGFLERPALYGTEVFRTRLEAQARSNLQRALARLAQPQ